MIKTIKRHPVKQCKMNEFVLIYLPFFDWLFYRH